MSNVIDIKQNPYAIDTAASALDANGKQLILGEKYELYIPIAKRAAQDLGLRFKDDVGYTFTYAGAALMGAEYYIVSPDVYYADEWVPKGVTPELMSLLTAKGQPHPVCPAFVAAQFVRPATDE